MNRPAFASALLSTVIAVQAASAAPVTVVEYYNSAVDAYFITGRAAEQQALDAQPGFVRTGMTFAAEEAATATVPEGKVCRFYISATSPYTSSHFYGQGADCQTLLQQTPPGFSYEGYDFATAVPSASACAPGTFPVYRSFRPAANGITPNHRYVTSNATLTVAQNAGFRSEGVAFCATAVTDATLMDAAKDTCGTFYYPNVRVSYRSVASDGVTSTFIRQHGGVSTSFQGYQDAAPVYDFSTSNLTHVIRENADEWTALGTREYDSIGLLESYFNPSVTIPKRMSIGQTVAGTQDITYSRDDGLGAVRRTFTLTFMGRETVTADAGTYRACKFTLQRQTTYSGPALNESDNMTLWVGDGVGVVKSYNQASEAIGTAVPTQRTVTVTAVAVDPLF